MNSNPSAAAWSVHDNRAALAAAPLTAELDGAAPGTGLQRLTWHGQPLPGPCLWQLVAPWFSASGTPPAERYARGHDLVITYGETPGFPVTTQVMWRLLPPGDLPEARQLELVVSTHTSVLDFHSSLRLGVSCELASPAEFTWLSAERGGVFRPERADMSAAFFAHPADFASVELASQAPREEHRARGFTLHARFAFLAQQLEKGVIRRVRLLAAWGPRAHDTEWISRCQANFAASPPPLTA